MPNKFDFKACLPAAFVCLAAVLLASGVSKGQQCSISPNSVNLGETLRLTCPAEVSSAKWNARTVKLFRQADGKSFGLMPVSVKDSPGPTSIEFLSKEGTAFATGKFLVRATRFPSENVRLSPDIEALRSTPEEIQLLTTFRNEVTDDRFWQDPLAPPVDGCVTSPFGVKRMHNGKPTGEFHGGVDQRTPAGEAIRAIASAKHVLNRVDFRTTHVKDLFAIDVFNEEIQRQRWRWFRNLFRGVAGWVAFLIWVGILAGLAFLVWLLVKYGFSWLGTKFEDWSK